MKKLHYYILDVFTEEVFGGNQLAVFPEGHEVPEHLMQKIAKELNLSETTFVLPPQNPDNDIKLRIFTPGKELPMAGHPTIGTAYTLLLKKHLDSENRTTLIFEEGVGDITIGFEMKGTEPGMITMQQPLPTFGNTFSDTTILADLLSLSPEDIATISPAQVVSCGVPFFYIPLQSLAAVKKAKLRADVLEKYAASIGCDSIFVFSTEAETANGTIHARMFAPSFGIPEDPATGGAAGPLGSYLVKYGLVPENPVAQIICEQGFEMGRPSILHITIGQENKEICLVKVGGRSAFVGEGYLHLQEL